MSMLFGIRIQRQHCIWHTPLDRCRKEYRKKVQKIRAHTCRYIQCSSWSLSLDPCSTGSGFCYGNALWHRNTWRCRKRTNPSSRCWQGQRGSVEFQVCGQRRDCASAYIFRALYHIWIPKILMMYPNFPTCSIRIDPRVHQGVDSWVGYKRCTSHLGLVPVECTAWCTPVALGLTQTWK